MFGKQFELCMIIGTLDWPLLLRGLIQRNQLGGRNNGGCSFRALSATNSVCDTRLFTIFCFHDNASGIASDNIRSVLIYDGLICFVGHSKARSNTPSVFYLILEHRLISN